MKQWQRIIIAGLALSLAHFAYGKEEPDKVTIQQLQLANGLQVLIKPVHAIPVVSVFIWYRVGSRDEVPGQSGAAHFLEHMLFKGTKDFAPGEIARQIERTGGHQNGFTSYDYTAYYETVPSEHLALALHIEADRMRRADLDPQAIEQERTVILSELDGNMNQPERRLHDLTNAQTWVNHPYRRPVIGWREEVAKITIEQLRDFYQRFYTPRNATLVLVGDVDPAAVQPLLEKYFSPLAAGPQLPERRNPPEEQNGQRRVELRDHGPAALVQINLPIPPAGHQDHFALSILNDVLTKGRSARLYRALVDTGLATRISGSPYEMIDSGVWTLQAVCQKGVDPQKVEAAIQREIKLAQKDLLDLREFQRSVNQTRAQLVFSKDSLTDQAMLLGFYQTVANDWRLLDTYPDKVAAVTPEQIRQAARTYLGETKMTIGHFLPLDGQAGGADSGVTADRAEHWVARQHAQREYALPQGRPGQGSAAASAGPSQGCSRFILSNGITLLVQKNPSTPMISVSALIKGGISHEPADKPGMALFHAEMLDRGTKKQTAAEFAEALEFKGMSLDFSARPEELHISGEALSEDTEQLLSAVADCLIQPVFAKTELEKVRQQLLSHVAMAKENSDMQAWQGFADLAYPAGHPLTRSLVQAETGIKNIHAKDISLYHQSQMAPEAMIFSISGDVDPESMRVMLERLFQAWPAQHNRTPWTPETLAPMPAVTAPASRRIALKGKSESIVVMGHEGIRRLDPEYYQALLANQILGGGGLASMLMREVREKQGLTYSIYTQFKPNTGVRPWILTFQADPAHVQKAVDAAIAQIKRLQNGQVERQAFVDVQEQLVGSLALNMETNSGIAQLNREIEYFGLGPDYREKYTAGVRAVTFEQMVQAANKWLHPERCLISIAEPEKK